MNRVSLVRGMRGIDAAARELFQKPANELTLAESVQIAAMLKAPTAYSPEILKKHCACAVNFKRNGAAKYISLDAARDAAAQLYGVTPAPDTNIFRYWTDFVADEIASRLGEEIDNDLLVYTTLDQDMHESCGSRAGT